MQTEPMIRGPKMTAKDEQFENLLRRAAEFLKSRPTPRPVKAVRKKHNAAA